MFSFVRLVTTASQRRVWHTGTMSSESPSLFNIVFSVCFCALAFVVLMATCQN